MGAVLLEGRSFYENLKMGAAQNGGEEEEAQTARWCWGLRGAPVTYWTPDPHPKGNVHILHIYF